MKLSQNLKCVLLRNGIEIWKEAGRLDELARYISAGKVGFVKIDDEMINAVDIIGIFSPATMVDHRNRRNGMWKCRYGHWHYRYEKCECLDTIISTKIYQDTEKYIKNQK